MDGRGLATGFKLFKPSGHSRTSDEEAYGCHKQTIDCKGGAKLECPKCGYRCDPKDISEPTNRWIMVI